jgi:hypothetical protein
MVAVFLVTLYSCKNEKSRQLDNTKEKNREIEILQERYQNLSSIILTADSVVIISHEVPEEFGANIVSDWDLSDSTIKETQKIQPKTGLKYYDRGRINRKLVIEHLLLTDKNKRVLADIFTSEVTQTSNHFQCDEPRHSILIYKNDMEFYVLLCFTCQRTHSSPRLWLSDSDFDNSKWQRLEQFFRKNNLTQILDKHK